MGVLYTSMFYELTQYRLFCLLSCTCTDYQGAKIEKNEETTYMIGLNGGILWWMERMGGLEFGGPSFEFGVLCLSCVLGFLFEGVNLSIRQLVNWVIGFAGWWLHLEGVGGCGKGRVLVSGFRVLGLCLSCVPGFLFERVNWLICPLGSAACFARIGWLVLRVGVWEEVQSSLNRRQLD